jgi:branched-chain amino acid transport system ATP-binding protein
MPLLEVSRINAFYGVFQAVFDVSLALERGDVVCLLGRNGAGKTTTLSAIAGLNPPRSGKVQFGGEDITGRKPYQVARLGIGLVPENRLIFPDLTTLENLELGCRNIDKGTSDERLKKIFELFPRLESLKDHRGGNLSGGEQQMLTIGRTLMGAPELLLMDELTTGLAPIVVQLLKTQIKRLKEENQTILLTEQNALFALDISDRAYIIDKGAIVYEGTVNELKENEQLMREYLGV